MQNSSNNSNNNGYHHDDGSQEVDIEKFFAYMMIMIERLGGECFVPTAQFSEMIAALGDHKKYLTWFDDTDTNSVVFKVMHVQQPKS